MRSIRLWSEFTRPQLAAMLRDALASEHPNYAYERSIFYVLNAARRGGLVLQSDSGLLVFAQDYDKPKSYSLVFFSQPDVLFSSAFEMFLSSQLVHRPIILHHLFHASAEKMLNTFPEGRTLAAADVKELDIYPLEDLFPQIVYPVHFLPQFGGSCFEKQKYILQQISEKRHSSFRKSILEYLNATEKGLNEPEVITAVLSDNTPQALRDLLAHIFDQVLSNWLRKRSDVDQSFAEYQLTPIRSLFSLLADRSIVKESQSKIVMRSHFDLELQHGGLWLGEIIPSKSLLIPHIILTDRHYKRQYTYLLYDLLSYSYLKSLDYVNLGGSEEHELYAIKKMPSEMFAERQMIERAVISVYIPRQRKLF